MSVSYRVLMRCALPPADVRERLAALTGATLDEDGYGVRGGMSFGVTEMSEARVALIEQTFGFRPRLSASFWPDPDAEPEVYRANVAVMGEAAARLVVEVDAEAVMLVDGEKILLQRRGGVLTLNDEYAPWTTMGLAERVPEPRFVTTLRSPLMDAPDEPPPPVAGGRSGPGPGGRGPVRG